MDPVSYNFPIDDLNAPQFEQALELAKIIKNAELNKHGVAVHCMAGIGRTSTMLMAAHLLLGETLVSLLAQLENRNPTFKFSGPQADFVRSVADRVEKGQVST
ncbi:MAG: protein-tyrosine phosphatase family protein [Pseudobdellovibrionaceae bacterium]